MSPEAGRGWDSSFPVFRETPAREVIARLRDFVSDASDEQVRAWQQSVPPLQVEVGEVVQADTSATRFTAILEYELPLESRRADVIFLVNGAVVVAELKGKAEPSQADLDQAAAYARDLRCYHRECADRPVHAILVPMRARGELGLRSGVLVCGPDAVDRVLGGLGRPQESALRAEAFLDEEAYRPLPTLVQAARELFKTKTLRRVKQAAALTDSACQEIAAIIRNAAQTASRRLVLLTGVPGAGKTLVGLQTVHSHWLDDLAVARPGGAASSPAIFLSGNGPLVEVLQYELREAGGDGRTFVRGVKDYLKAYTRSAARTPPEHVLVFDEAQRAWDADYVRHKHGGDKASGKSEPAHFIEIASRIPTWCVVVGLVGGGQEIHVGEEAGLEQWRRAIEESPRPAEWSVHGPPQMARLFADGSTAFNASTHLSLDTAIRFHLTRDVHRYVAGLLDAVPARENAARAAAIARDRYQLRISRNLDIAKEYLRERFSDDLGARYGVLASSKDRDLLAFRVFNDFQSTKRVRFGPWYGGQEDREPQSCRHLDTCVTEFGAQGLELDAALVAWGTDFILKDGCWSNASARGYKRGGPEVKDPMRLRANSYRVLLTRGRSATVIFVPPLPQLDETYAYLCASGFEPLTESH